MGTTDETTRHRRLIEEALKKHGFNSVTDSDWSEDEENESRPRVALGDWVVSEDDESEGLYEGDEGTLSATVVGGLEYHNERVAFYFRLSGSDEDLCQVEPFFGVEPAS